MEGKYFSPKCIHQDMNQDWQAGVTWSVKHAVVGSVNFHTGEAASPRAQGPFISCIALLSGRLSGPLRLFPTKSATAALAIKCSLFSGLTNFYAPKSLDQQNAVWSLNQCPYTAHWWGTTCQFCCLGAKERDAMENTATLQNKEKFLLVGPATSLPRKRRSKLVVLVCSQWGHMLSYANYPSAPWRVQSKNYRITPVIFRYWAAPLLPGNIVSLFQGCRIYKKVTRIVCLVICIQNYGEQSAVAAAMDLQHLCNAL